MEECMDCVETIARLHLYIDHELSVDEVAIVQQHLVACPNCECRFYFDISLKRLLHDCCALERAPDHVQGTEAELEAIEKSVGETVSVEGAGGGE